MRVTHTHILSTLSLSYCPSIYLDSVLLSDKKISHKQQLCHPRISKHLNFERLLMKSCLNESIIPLYNIYNTKYPQFRLIVPRQSFSAGWTEKDEDCVHFVAVLASKDQIFFFHHFLPSSFSSDTSCRPNCILYCQYAKPLKA